MEPSKLARFRNSLGYSNQDFPIKWFWTVEKKKKILVLDFSGDVNGVAIYWDTKTDKNVDCRILDIRRSLMELFSFDT